MRDEIPSITVPPSPSAEEKIEVIPRPKRFTFLDPIESTTADSSTFSCFPVSVVVPTTPRSPLGSPKISRGLVFESNASSSVNTPDVREKSEKDKSEKGKSEKDKSEKPLVSILKSPSLSGTGTGTGTRNGSLIEKNLTSSPYGDEVSSTLTEAKDQLTRDQVSFKEDNIGQSSLAKCFQLKFDVLENDNDNYNGDKIYNCDRKTKEEEKEIEKEKSAGDERLTVGLIDYALLIGPLDDGSSGPLGMDSILNGFSEKYSQKYSENKRIQVQYSLHPDSENGFIACSTYGANVREIEKQQSQSPRSPSTPKSTTSSSGGGVTMESDMCIWDRFPMEDHEESPLPAKIEYFACPDGSKVVKSKTR